jgi:hypothetical protein
MARRQTRKEQAPKRPHLAIKRDRKKRREISRYAEKRRRDLGIIEN